MKVETKRENGIFIVFVEGEVDAVTCDELQQKIDDLIEKGASSILLDLAGVDYISSAGLRVLLSTAKKLYSKGVFAISRPKPTVAEILEMVGLASVISVYDDLEAAKKEMGS